MTDYYIVTWQDGVLAQNHTKVLKILIVNNIIQAEVGYYKSTLSDGTEIIFTKHEIFTDERSARNYAIKSLSGTFKLAMIQKHKEFDENLTRLIGD